jgi:hypothetical protein
MVVPGFTSGCCIGNWHPAGAGVVSSGRQARPFNRPSEHCENADEVAETVSEIEWTPLIAPIPFHAAEKCDETERKTCNRL